MTEGGEVWFLPDPRGEGTLILNAHPEGECSGKWCALHKPSPHAMRDWPMRWEWDRENGGEMHRLCPCGYWHEDPDDRAYRIRVAKVRWRPDRWHKCCLKGCCQPTLVPLAWPDDPKLSLPF